MLQSLLKESAAEMIGSVHVEDDPLKTKYAIVNAAKSSQIIITSGGVPMGVHDHVRDMALQAGFEQLFWKVKQKPGKPMFVAKKEGTLLISLPGNPVSAFMCFKHYVQPLLKNIQGKNFDWPKTKSEISHNIENKGDRLQMMRVRFVHNQADFPEIEVVTKQGSNMSSSIAHADGYIIVAENETINAGALIDFYPF